MEKELIASMKRNLKRHKAEEKKVGFEFPQWQAEKLKSLREYRHENRTIINTYTKGLNKGVTRLLDESYKDGKRGAYDEFIEAKEKGYELDVDISDSFFQTNSKKANTMIKVINNDLKKANNACLRRSNDIYREVIHKASTFVSNGVYTEKKAVDMAIKEFASKGINCIVYKNGAKHTISNYAAMAIRTANQRAQLMAEGEFRKEIGEVLVTVSKHGTACEICQQFEGKVYIDDVYSGGTKKDGKYPLLSEAMKQGMFHPNCRHGLNTYYDLEDIDDVASDTNVGHKEETPKTTTQEPVFNNFEDYKKYVDKLQPEVENDKSDLETIKYWEEQIKQGNHRPILVDENDMYHIVDGNHTLVAYKNLDVVPPDIYKVNKKDMFNAVANGEHELDWANRLIKENKVQKLYNGAMTPTETTEVAQVKKIRKTMTEQYDYPDQLNQYEYYSKEQEQYRLNAIKELTGYDDEEAQVTLEAFCGDSYEFDLSMRYKGEYKSGWFYGEDNNIRNKSTSEAEFKAIVIDEYIQSAPRFEGTLYRGLALDEELVNSFEKGGTFTEKGVLSSWTETDNVANNFAKTRAKEFAKRPVIIECSNIEDCTPVGHLSIFGIEENEVIVSNFRNNEYEIIDIIKKEEITIIKVKEKHNASKKSK